MRLKFGNVVAVLALVVAVGGPAVAGAQNFLTGRDVQDESLTGADIENHTLSAADIRAGSLGSGLFSPRALANLRGASGAQGAKGETGAAGPPGPAGNGVTATTATGPDVSNYQDYDPFVTATLSQPEDYVLFAGITAHNTGSSDDNLNCGLFIGGSAFGGGGLAVPAGATGDFSAVGATHLRAGQSETVTLKCIGGGVTTYDLSRIELRTHGLG
jgi:hypothetical protein